MIKTDYKKEFTCLKYKIRCNMRNFKNVNFNSLNKKDKITFDSIKLKSLMAYEVCNKQLLRIYKLSQKSDEKTGG